MTRYACVCLAVLTAVGLTGVVASAQATPAPQPKGHILTVAEAGTGSGSVTSSDGTIACPPTCSHTYTATGPVTLTATPAPGSTFAGWSGPCTGTAPTCTVSMTSDQMVTATFIPTGSSPPPSPPPAPTCTLRMPSMRVLLKAAKSHPAQARQVDRLTFKATCDQKVSVTFTVKVVEFVPGTHHHRVTFKLTKRFSLAAHHTDTLSLRLWPGAVHGLKRHYRETIHVTFAATNANGGAGAAMVATLKPVG